MTKFTYSPLANLSNESSAVSTINANFAALQILIETLLSRDGTSPNSMEADIDLDSNDLLNVQSVTAQGIVVTDSLTLDSESITSWNDLLALIDVTGLSVSVYDPASVQEQVVGLTATQTLTNKTLTSPVINSPVLSADSVDAITEIASSLKSGEDSTLVTGTAGTDGNLLEWNSDGDVIDSGLATDNVVVSTSIREKLTGNRTYYVDASNGSDSNTGLSPGAGAFATLVKAWNTLASIDGNGYTATISVADDTYSNGIISSQHLIGFSQISITGNTSTPANCHINTTEDCFRFSAPLPCPMEINGFKLTFAGANARAVALLTLGTITIENLELAGGSTGFGNAVYAEGGSALIYWGIGINITGNMSSLVGASRGGTVQFYGVTVTLTGTPAWSWVGFFVQHGGIIQTSGVTFSGSATGQRYVSQSNGIINTGGTGPSGLPGDSSGSTSTQGQYF